MNSEEKLMAKKIEKANKNKLQKQKSGKLARVGSGNDRKKPTVLKKNSSQFMTSTASGFSQRIKEKSSDKYSKYMNSKKLVTKASKKRIGSPNLEKDKKNQENSNFEKESDKMKKKNLRIGSDNNRKDPGNHYPFPLTPLEKATNKPIDFEDDLAVMKSQSTRNKGRKTVNFLGKQYPDPTKIILPNHEPTKCSVKRNGVIKAYGANTNQGIVRNYNEDRVSIILNIMKPPNKKDVEYWPKCSFFGVFDGHGGANCADFLRDNLHQFIIRDDSFPEFPKEAIKKAFAKAEKCFLEMAEIEATRTGDYSQLDKSGSCAICCLIVEDMCYVVNVGDSRALMSVDGGEKIYPLSRDHRPTDEIETKRIIEAGGKIYQTQTMAKIPGLGGLGIKSQYLLGPHRVLPGRLSVSRTFGDIEAKLQKYGGNPNVVIAIPDIKAFRIQKDHDFIVLGCDGIFDKLSNRDVVNCCWYTVNHERAGNVHKQCGKAIDLVLKASIAKRTLDNITVVMVAFTNFKKLAFPSSMPDNKNDIKNGESRGGSALEHRDNTSHCKPLSGSNKQRGKEETKGGLDGRKSEEPPDRISYKIKRITNGKREDNASPDYSSKNMKTIPKDKISLKHDKPVQIIMKVGNLFLSNVNQASSKNTHEEED